LPVLVLVLVLVGGFIFGGRRTRDGVVVVNDEDDDDDDAAATATANSPVDVSASMSISILFDLRQQSLEDLLMGISKKSSLLALRFRPTVC